MIKIKTIEKTEKIEEIQDIACNLCGLSLSNNIREGHLTNFGYSGLSTVIHGGYDSKAIGDMTKIRFDICEHCLIDKVFPLFIIELEYSSEYVPEWTVASKFPAAQQEAFDFLNKLYSQDGEEK
jgi:hypothetical protein